MKKLDLITQIEIATFTAMGFSNRMVRDRTGVSDSSIQKYTTTKRREYRDGVSREARFIEGRTRSYIERVHSRKMGLSNAQVRQLR